MLDHKRFGQNIHVPEHLVDGVLILAVLSIAVLGRSYMKKANDTYKAARPEVPAITLPITAPIISGAIFVDTGVTREGIEYLCEGIMDDSDTPLWPGDIAKLKGKRIGTLGCPTVQQRFEGCEIMGKNDAKEAGKEGEASLGTQELADALSTLGLGISDITSENAKRITAANHHSHGSDTVFVCDPQ